MGNYKLPDKLEEVSFWVNPENFIISDLMQSSEKFNTETLKIRIPGFSHILKMKQECVNLLFNNIDENSFGLLLLKRCLKDCSFWDIKLNGSIEDLDSVIEQKCFEEMCGPKGVHPKILAHVVDIIRLRTS